MAVLLGTVLLDVVAIAGIIVLTMFSTTIPASVVGVGWLFCNILIFVGLKVLKPQEAMVFTLFGNYVGTLKEDGFFWVNPFCTAFNPAGKPD